ncbi:hypothetical protein [Yersinia intermedia]|nr:hypothetical protein [Yersinia intermedia]
MVIILNINVLCCNSAPTKAALTDKEIAAVASLMRVRSARLGITV